MIINDYGSYGMSYRRVLLDKNIAFLKMDAQGKNVRKNTPEKSKTASVIEQLNERFKPENTDPLSAYRKHYCFPWIDDLKLKLDRDRPMTKEEEEYLRTIQLNMYVDQIWRNTKGENVRVKPPWDEDGYILHGTIEEAKSYTIHRDAMNTEIQSLLNKAGINLGKDEVFTITVDFNSVVTISGLEDETKAVNIAKILNDAKLGGRFFGHIMSAELRDPYEYGIITREDSWSKHINGMLMDYVGCSLSDLDYRQNGVYTKDGKDIIDVFNDAVDKDAALKGYSYASEFKRQFAEAIKGYQKQGGIGDVSGINLSIDFKNGKLYDTEVEYGFGEGQMDWFDKLLSLRGNMTEILKFQAEMGFKFALAFNF